MKSCTHCGSAKGKIIGSLCWSHYLQKRRHGRFLELTKYTPNVFVDCGEYTEIVILKQDGTEKCRAIIDTQFADVARHFKWNAQRARKKLYAVCITHQMLLHHFIIGKPPTGLVTDHINGNSLDNRRANLRHVTQAVNCANRTRYSVEQLVH